jgi:hypothetical protein
MIDEDKPPLFKRWTSWYYLVIGFLIFQILLFAMFTKYFA